MKIAVTGGAGFIGSALVRHLIQATHHDVLVIDKLTYSGNLASLSSAHKNSRYRFAKADICDRSTVDRLFADFSPDAVMHLAAESHVDRSIDGPAEFINTNVLGTYVLLEAALAHWRRNPTHSRNFRFLHVSTDEVYGSLAAEGRFTEESRYDPRSPYSATKAASDHLVRAWHHTYGLPTLLTNCSNNYGPFQFPEKLIPLMIIKGLGGEPLPVYGSGSNIRDWLFVEDHVKTLTLVLERGRPGETYNIGGGSERRNIDVVKSICDRMDMSLRRSNDQSHHRLISFVQDRPGHDFRYAIDYKKLSTELGWAPTHDFESGLSKTVDWYLNNKQWWSPLLQNYDASNRRGLSLSKTR